MKLSIDTGYQLQMVMTRSGRDYYSPAGYDALLEHYNALDPDMEVDPVAICGEFTEYGEGVKCSFSSLISEYSYLMDYTPDGDTDEEEYLEALVNKLARYAMVLELHNGNYLVFNF